MTAIPAVTCTVQEHHRRVLSKTTLIFLLNLHGMEVPSSAGMGVDGSGNVSLWWQDAPEEYEVPVLDDTAATCGP